VERQINHTSQGALEGARVLIVEDDAILLMDLESMLRGAGAQTLGCRTVGEGLAAAEIEGISAAVLDVRVRDVTVEPIARRLTQRGIPFIFYTGQIGDDPAIAEWADRKIIPKPACARTIIPVVADILR
jgi:DNA-binding NtrC family response regulator